ncbi:MAG: GspE/PulE family protein [Gammaproteobacteria bacterium]
MPDYKIENLNQPTGTDLVDQLLRRAADLRASDIHLQPQQQDCVRMRVNGLLYSEQTQMALDLFSQYPAAISRLKILAHLNIAERRMPQDGRIRYQIKGLSIDVRLSLVPVAGSERAVLRLIYQTGALTALDQLGLPDQSLDTIRKHIALGQGLILVVGPTGSGKTTTLYSVLNGLNTQEKCILAVEDPIERLIPGVGQVQVHPEIGLGFSHVLRAFLRQDPEIIMVGEMRDTETAQIAVRASLTGHMVLSTLHAPNSLSSISRLRDMGLESWLIGATINVIIAQRLVRILCPKCIRIDDDGSRLAQHQGIIPADTQLMTSDGCDQCRMSGYSTRRGIFEVLPVSSQLKEGIAQKLPEQDLQQACGDYTQLVQTAIQLMKQGEIDLKEFWRLPI